jgi:hypothetical protein
LFQSLPAGWLEQILKSLSWSMEASSRLELGAVARFFFVLKNICRLHLFFSTETQKERVAGNAVPICAFYKRTIA